MSVSNLEHFTPHQDISNSYLQYERIPNVDQNGDTITMLRQSGSYALGVFQRQIDEEFGTILRQEQVEPSNASELIASARWFVESLTGMTVDTNIIWHKSINGGKNTGISYVMSGLIGAVDIERSPNMGPASVHYWWMANTSNLVHEMTHHTGLATRQVVGIVVPDPNEPDSKLLLNTGAAAGMTPLDFRGYNYETNVGVAGSFFEEAFAEEAAARWRESVEPVRAIYDDKHTIYVEDNVPMLWRYLQTETALNERSTNFNIFGWRGYSQSAYCSEAIRLVSEHTGVDIFSLMIESRSPATEASAKRRIVQVVESVQPGLYKALRDLPYGEEHFIEGYDAVKKALASARG